MFSIKGLSDADLEVLRKHLVRRDILKNSVLYENGRESKAMFFLESGAVKLVQRKSTGDSGDDVVMSVIKPGGFCGEEALLGEHSGYLTTAIALETSVLLELSRDNLQMLMLSSMSTGTKILLGITKNYREAIVVSESTARTLVFYSPKDGVGKTSLAINTAIALAQAGKKVAVLDADFQFGNAHLHLGLLPTPNITRMIQMEEHLVFDRIKHFFQQKEGVTILACPDLAQEAELVTRSNLNQVIQEMSRNFDFLIIDAPSHLNEQTLLLWDTADRLILVSEPDLSSLTRSHRLFRVLSRLDYAKEKFTCLVNRYTPEASGLLEEFKKIAPSALFTIGEDTLTARNSILHGVPWSKEKPGSKMVKDLEVFVDSLLGHDTHQTKPVEERKGGIFNRIRSFLAQ